MNKTWGYLVAIEAEEMIDPSIVVDAIYEYIEQSQVAEEPIPYAKMIEVECLGELDVYPEGVDEVLDAEVVHES